MEFRKGISLQAGTCSINFFLDTNSLALTFQDLERTRNILFSITLAINSMLLFLLLFEDRIVLPGWLQVTGRMHPMFLHFPIVLVVLYALWVLFFFRKESRLRIQPGR